jgi:hypothetical protein
MCILAGGNTLREQKVDVKEKLVDTEHSALYADLVASASDS